MPFTPQTKTRNCSSRKSGKYRSTSAQRDRGKKTAADSEGSNGRGTVSRCVHRNGEIGPRVTKLTGAKIRLHALRHYYASALIATGAASIVEIAKLMGHKDATITLKVYAHFLSRDDAPTAAFMAVSDGLF